MLKATESSSQLDVDQGKFIEFNEKMTQLIIDATGHESWRKKVYQFYKYDALSGAVVIVCVLSTPMHFSRGLIMREYAQT